MKIGEEIEKLNEQMGGFKEMTSLPDALFIVDPVKSNPPPLENGVKKSRCIG